MGIHGPITGETSIICFDHITTVTTFISLNNAMMLSNSWILRTRSEVSGQWLVLNGQWIRGEVRV